MAKLPWCVRVAVVSGRKLGGSHCRPIKVRSPTGRPGKELPPKNQRSAATICPADPLTLVSTSKPTGFETASRQV
jgi:hypothetical protein